jgi:hypothetical protein
MGFILTAGMMAGSARVLDAAGQEATRTLVPAQQP